MTNNGKIKWYNSTKGYGFITPDNGEKDVFLHRSALESSSIGSIDEGQNVSYDIETASNGKVSATNLKLS